MMLLQLVSDDMTTIMMVRTTTKGGNGSGDFGNDESLIYTTDLE